MAINLAWCKRGFKVIFDFANWCLSNHINATFGQVIRTHYPELLSETCKLSVLANYNIKINHKILVKHTRIFL